MTNALEGILNRPKTIFSLMIAILIAGIIAFLTIPKEAAPNIDIPFYYISISQQGISPEDGERLIARPMETELRGLEGLKEITTMSTEGHVGILLEFHIDVSKDKALADVREKVDLAKSKIPADADEPSVNSFNMALNPTMFIAVYGDVSERTLYHEARKLKDVIEAVPTVKSADLSGHREELLEVTIDTMKMESYSITQAELLRTVTQNNQLIAAGFIDGAGGRFSIKVPGLVETARDVYSIPLKQAGEAVVTLGDIATIRRTFKDHSSYSLVNGKKAITLEVVKRLGQNVIENNQAVMEAVNKATANTPSTIKTSFMLDDSKKVDVMLGSLQTSIMTAIMLVMIVVVASLGLKSALLVGLAIPTSFMTGFFILSMSGMTVNNMVMFGLVLTVGMLVDGAIVMVEYADRKVAEGMNATQAYIRASRLMFWPIVSSTATTIAAFLPMLMWPGIMGKFMSYLPLMVIIVLISALATALVFLPVTGGIMSSVFRFISRHGEAFLGLLIGTCVGIVLVDLPYLAIPEEGKALVIIALALICGWFLRPLFKPVMNYSRRKAAERHAQELEDGKIFLGKRFDPKKVKGATGVYVRALAKMASTPIGNIATLVGMVLLCFGIISYFMQNSKGVENFVESEPLLAQAYVSARGNMSVEEAFKLVQEVDNIIINVDGIKDVVTTAFPSGSKTSMQDIPADLIGQVYFEFTDFCCRRNSEAIFNEIREKTSKIAGIKVEVRAEEGGPPQGKDVQVEVKSTDYALLDGVVDRVRTKLESMEGLRDFEDGRPLPGIEWLLSIDRAQAARYQAQIVPVGAMVQLVTNGIKIGSYRPTDSEDEVDIRVRLPEQQRTLERIDQLRLQTQLGQVPLSNFIKQSPQQKVSTIIRRDGYYVMDVKANVDKAAGYLPDNKVQELKTWIDSEQWPEGVTLGFRGNEESQQESAAFLQKAMLASLFLMFAILLTQYNSFYQTFLTLSTVVMSMVGVMLGMAITGQKFSVVMTGTGVLALAGIVVNNSIVLIDTYNRFRHDGMVPVDAILKTCTQRIRPILLTTITTIAGLIPMATQISFDFAGRVISINQFGSEWWVSLATAVISGLAFSTLLTLIVIPTLIAMPSVWYQAWRNRKRKSQKKLNELFSTDGFSPAGNDMGDIKEVETPEFIGVKPRKSTEAAE
ncbi:efflux RND transporter permease subunit [Polycladidibacter stylochi]|uniref:efflux RND transporter permease subunit n=1 Tax=Polycladidibacter stylochi TaxID=1807766 RepID=UPI00082B3602|nr:efflux RND transporter permease subunit [Pseudovibrio stylochi]